MEKCYNQWLMLKKQRPTQAIRGMRISLMALILGTIFLISMGADAYASGSSTLQGKDVTGTVKDADGIPLPGVAIVVKGSTGGVITDLNGSYTVTGVPEDAILVFSYIAMITQEVPVVGLTTIDITLEEDLIGLEEVVVIGYGTMKKSDLTGSVGSVSSDELENIPNTRVDQILQGRAAGVQVTSANGSPGAPTTIRIRGGNSIEGSNEPLWVIDGIIVGLNYDLNNLNTNDIESIEILKDASSVSIYGARGANGVVLVTTKSGRMQYGGKPVVTFNLSGGVQSHLGKVELLDGFQHAAYVNEGNEFTDQALAFPDPDNVANTDWYDLLMQPAPIYNADLSIGGGTGDGRLNYFVSGNYANQQGIVITSGIEKYIFRTNLDFHLSDKITAGLRMNVSRIDRDNGTVGYGNVLNTHREQPVYDQNGEYFGYNLISGGPQVNPVANSEQNINETTTNSMIGTLFLEIKPTEKWLIRTTFNPEMLNSKTNVFHSSQAPDKVYVGDSGDASIGTVSAFGWNNENTVQYSTDIGQSFLTVLGGFSLQKYSAETTLTEAYGITSDATTFNNLGLGSDPTRNVVGSGYNAFQVVSFFARINYTLKDKYLFTLVGRSDGSSRFAPGNKYAFFPSAAVAWKLHNEDFIANMGVFSTLKLRASYGIAGSQAIESFRTLAVMEDASTTYNEVLNAGATIGRPKNEGLKWETTRQLDIGLEMGFFKGRLTTEMDFYKKNTFDLLLSVLIPGQTGYKSQLRNLGEVQNQGIELMINSVNISKSDFSWSTSLMLSVNRNKVLDLGGPTYINTASPNQQAGPAARLIVGEPAPVFSGVNYLGTWKNQEDIDASGQVNQDVGGARFHDPDGNGQINEDDFYVLGSPEANFIYGLDNTLRYKNLAFSFFIQGTQGNEVYNQRTHTFFFGREPNKYIEVLDRYTESNTSSDIPRAGSMVGLSEIPNNSEFIENGSHLRLKSVRLSYDFPVQNWGSDVVKGLTIYFSGNNLLLLSNFRLIDPETSFYGQHNINLGFAGGEYPSARMVTFGVSATF